MYWRPVLLLSAIVVGTVLVGGGVYLTLSHRKPVSSVVIPSPQPPRPRVYAPTLAPTARTGTPSTQLMILQPIVASSSRYAPPARMLAVWETTPAIPPSPRTVAANLPSPIQTGPPDGTQLASLSAVLSWRNPGGTTQYHLQVIPWNNDGPGIDLIMGDPAQVAKASYTIPPPQFGQGPYIMLPGAIYSWKVRVSDARTSISPDDPSWSFWSATRTFTTPKPDASTIQLVSPSTWAMVTSTTPTLRWSDTNTQVFYYEIQLSSDPNFRTDRSEAVAPVYWNLVHGGMTTPLNSWTVPASAALQSGTTYYWRVRPRVQATVLGEQEVGVSWSSTNVFPVKL